MNLQNNKNTKTSNNNLKDLVKSLEITRNENISDEIDAWTFIRTVEKPSSSLKRFVKFLFNLKNVFKL